MSTDTDSAHTSAANAALEALQAKLGLPAHRRPSLSEAIAAVSGLTHNTQFTSRFVEVEEFDLDDLPPRSCGGVSGALVMRTRIGMMAEALAEKPLHDLAAEFHRVMERAADADEDGFPHSADDLRDEAHLVSAIGIYRFGKHVWRQGVKDAAQ